MKFTTLMLLGFVSYICAEVPKTADKTPLVKVNKCCEKNEIYIGSHCVRTNKTSEQWRPLFFTEKGDANLQVNYTLVIGLPDCGHMQRWPIYHYFNSTDRLRLLSNGKLRHYFDHIEIPDEFDLDNQNPKAPFHDYELGKYCLERVPNNGRPNKLEKSCTVSQDPPRVVALHDDDDLIFKSNVPSIDGYNYDFNFLYNKFQLLPLYFE